MIRTAPLHLLHQGLAQRAHSLIAGGVLSPTDLLLVDAVAGRFDESDPDVLLGLAFAVRAPRAGHVGVLLSRVREQVDDELSAPRSQAEAPVVVDWPANPQAWEAAVLASSMVGQPADLGRPFVCQVLRDGSRLLLTRRMWREQERLALALSQLASSSPALVLSDQAVLSGVHALFGGPDSQGARAVKSAASRRLTVVTGGPGTGKTYSIKRLLALLVQAADPACPLRIELAAPTGKAAVRMAEAIAEQLDQLPVAPAVRERLASLAPRTLHKLLGMRPDGSSRHGPERPVPADLIVVDEASMVDLALMRRLFEAVPAGARLILLGDRDQLASVEAGTVLADIVGPVLDRTGSTNTPLHAAIVPFTTNHRFHRAPTIAAIAGALQGAEAGAVERVCGWMQGHDLPSSETLPDRVTHLGVPPAGRATDAQLDALAAPYLAASGPIGALAAALRAHGAHASALQQPSFHLSLLRALEGYRVLAVHRRGPLGVSGLERALVRRCQQALRDAIRARSSTDPRVAVRLPARGSFWLGRPVLITRNAYDVGLMNGDIGLVLPTAEGLAAVFPQRVDGVDSTRVVALARLPEQMGALAMTVHKSQGSQFRRVAVVLAGRDSPIQTRELIYTAITRTSARLDWLGHPDELRRALERPVGRMSGLKDLLWGEVPA